MGDDAKWDTVKARVRAGSGDPLSVLGYVGDVDKHPVCQAVLGYVGAVGKKGSDIRDKFTGQGYGWPKDTVEGALLALLASGNLRALQNGTPVAAPQVDQTKLGQTEFRVEGATITTVQRIAVEKLVKEGGVAYKTGEVAVAAPSLVPLLIALAQAAGGGTSTALAARYGPTGGAEVAERQRVATGTIPGPRTADRRAEGLAGKKTTGRGAASPVAAFSAAA